MDPRRRALRAKGFQVLRRAAQLTAVALMILAPVLARYHNYVAARELDNALKRWGHRPQGRILAALDSGVRALPGGEKERVGRLIRDRDQAMRRSQLLRGGPWSSKIGPVSMTDPLAGAESIAASKSIVGVLIYGLAIPLAVTLLLGRVFCSWVCPFGFLLELTDKLRPALAFLELKPLNIRWPRWTKYLLLGVGLALTFACSIPFLGAIYPPAIVGRETRTVVFSFFDAAESGAVGLGLVAGLSSMSLFLLVIIGLEVTVSRRFWCRSMCPGGALYSLLGAFRLLRVQRSKDKCTLCGDCVPACPMGLAPMNDAMGMECDSCGLCIRSCGDDALRFGLTQRRDLQERPEVMNV